MAVEGTLTAANYHYGADYETNEVYISVGEEHLKLRPENAIALALGLLAYVTRLQDHERKMKGMGLPKEFATDPLKEPLVDDV